MVLISVIDKMYGARLISNSAVFILCLQAYNDWILQ